MVRDICEGLEYLHRSRVIHRDIKLENIMLSAKGNIKIVDLGESNFYGEEVSRKTMRGTKTYFCPEVINHDQQDDKVDVWCLGVIIYELVCLESPFTGATEKDIIENIRVTLGVFRDFAILFPRKSNIRSNCWIYFPGFLLGRLSEYQ